MRLACIIALFFVVVSLITAKDSNAVDTCLACESGWCTCDNKIMQCAWETDRPYQWFRGCGQYEVLVLYPEMSYIERPRPFHTNQNQQRMLNQELLFGLDGLKTLIINRHCIIENNAFAKVKAIEEVEINWKSKAVLLKSSKDGPKDRPALLKDSLADLTDTTKLSGSKSFTASVKEFQSKKGQNFICYCSLTQTERTISARQSELYKSLRDMGDRLRSAKESPLADSKQLHRSISSQKASVDDPKQPHPSTSGLEEDSTLLNDGISSFHITEGAGLESDDELDAREAQLKYTVSVDETKTVNHAIRPPFGEDSSSSHIAPGFMSYSNGTLLSAVEQRENGLVCQQVCNPIYEPVTVMDDVSHASSEDPEFAVIGAVNEFDNSFGAGKEKGISKTPLSNPYSASGKDNYVEVQGHRAISDWLPAVPLGFVTELPVDISELFKAEYLFTEDVMENVADPPKPSPLMGRYGCSIFAEYDNWII